MRSDEIRMPVLLRLERRREEAARVMQAAVPGALKRHVIRGALHMPSLSEARNGGRANPIFRVAVLLEAMRQAGAPRERAELVVAHIAGVIDEMWPVSEIDLDAAFDREQAKDAQEEIEQLRAQRDPIHLPEWAVAAEEHIAAARVAVAVARRQIQRTRKVA